MSTPVRSRRYAWMGAAGFHRPAAETRTTRRWSTACRAGSGCQVCRSEVEERSGLVNVDIRLRLVCVAAGGRLGCVLGVLGRRLALGFTVGLDLDLDLDLALDLDLDVGLGVGLGVG